MRKKYLTKTLVIALIVMVICLATFVGTTFAWLTDTVTSSSNILKSGSLDVEMLYKTQQGGEVEAQWSDATNAQIFNSENLAEGSTIVKFIKVKNTGSLAFKYEFNLKTEVTPTANTDDFDLTDVIDVYVINLTDSVPVAREDLNDTTRVGTMTDILLQGKSLFTGVLYPNSDENANHNKEITVAVVVQMRSDVDDGYRGRAVSGFTVQLHATQIMTEVDAFAPIPDEDLDY